MQATKQKRWYIQWDEQSSDFTEGLVHERIEGSRMLYAIAKIEDVPIDENGDLVRDGEDAERLRTFACSFTHRTCCVKSKWQSSDSKK
jgi:hypothetical protein